MSERTFSIIKPDAVKAGQAGDILARVEKSGFKLVALRLRHLSRAPGSPKMCHPYLPFWCN